MHVTYIFIQTRGKKLHSISQNPLLKIWLTNVYIHIYEIIILILLIEKAKHPWQNGLFSVLDKLHLPPLSLYRLLSPVALKLHASSLRFVQVGASSPLSFEITSTSFKVYNSLKKKKSGQNNLVSSK